MAKDLNVFDKEYGLLINGEWTKGSEGKLLSSYNPANGDELAKFTDATDADVDAAVAAAQEAFKTWRKTTTAERAAILNKIADVIDENAELFACKKPWTTANPSAKPALPMCLWLPTISAILPALSAAKKALQPNLMPKTYPSFCANRSALSAKSFLGTSHS